MAAAMADLPLGSFQLSLHGCSLMTMATALSIGMFDGVHAGHREIIDQARRTVGPDGRVIVVTFEPAPAAILSPEHVFSRLMTDRQRHSALMDAGVDEVHVLEPTTEFLQQSPRAFLDQLLVDHQPHFIMEGQDFRFGCHREGDIELLQVIGSERGFQVHLVEDVEATLVDGTRVPARSSVIRKLIQKGRVRDAAGLLGRPWQLDGIVVKGMQRGRELGCPTANLDAGCMILPAAGVYAGRAYLESGEAYPAAISVGTNPTFEDGCLTCEVHLLGFDGEVGDYGWPLRVDVDHWIREQLVFDSLDLLTEAMARDLQRVQELMSV